MSAVRAAVAAATRTLRDAGVDSARFDAEALAAHVLGVERRDLVRAPERALDETLDRARRRSFEDLVARRAAREPLQHLLGATGFRHLELAVGPGVFVPRPETESVVQWAVDTLRARGPAEPLVVDLCTGPGTIALALAAEVPGARVHAVEVDRDALRWARRNAAARAEAGDPPVRLHLADAADALPELDGTVDLVASNPPYVAEHELAGVDLEVRDHDPRHALLAGPDGLDVIRVVERAARRLLRPGGAVVVEHSDRQGRSAPAVFADNTCWDDVVDHRDLVGRDRFVTAVRRAT